jgi:hypothetical protein
VSKSSVIFFVSLGCLLLGVMLGIAGTYLVIMPHCTKMASRTFFTSEAYKLGEDAQRSFHAYKHESKPVAIYALSEHLAALKKAKDIPENARLLNDRGLYLELMLAHARVAKLYAETEQTNLSAEHFSEALKCAAEAGDGAAITNQISLQATVDRIDRNAHD